MNTIESIEMVIHQNTKHRESINEINDFAAKCWKRQYEILLAEIANKFKSKEEFKKDFPLLYNEIYNDGYTNALAAQKHSRQ
jgi:hypothetical protein